jgi:TrpR family transcriptional regulator, trp operon repressor
MNDFLTLCQKATRQELEELFDLFFTDEERSHIKGRIDIISHLLSKKNTQREIAEQCSLSIVKITRGSNALKRTTPQIKAYLRRILCLQK